MEQKWLIEQMAQYNEINICTHHIFALKYIMLGMYDGVK